MEDFNQIQNMLRIWIKCMQKSGKFDLMEAIKLFGFKFSINYLAQLNPILFSFALQKLIRKSISSLLSRI